MALAPPRITDSDCSFAFTTGTKKKTFNYEYRASQTTLITVAPTVNHMEFLITETAVTDYSFTSVEFILLDGLLKSTNAIYEMNIDELSDTETKVVPLSGDLPAGKFQVRAESYLGFAVPSTLYIEIAWSTAPTVDSPVTSSFAGGPELTLLGTQFETNTIEDNFVTVCG